MIWRDSPAERTIEGIGPTYHKALAAARTKREAFEALGYRVVGGTLPAASYGPLGRLTWRCSLRLRKEGRP